MADEETAQKPTEGQEEAQDSILSKESTLSYVGIFVSAIILLIALTSKNNGHEDHKHYEYGIAVASIAMIFSAIGWFLALSDKPEFDKALLYNNYFLFLWNFFGASFLTFGGPFKHTGNGYFAAWGLVIFATMALGVNASALQQQVENVTTGASAALFACSIVLLTAISSNGVSSDDNNFGELVYGLIVTIITILIMGAMLRGGVARGETSSQKSLQLYVMAFMVILWSIAAGLLTFRGPFLVTGNGYFGSWGGAFAAVYGVNAARKAQSEDS